jgi:hypothetical protein
MGHATANNVPMPENNNAPPCAELRAVTTASIEIWYAGRFIGGIEGEPGGFRIILAGIGEGGIDPGGGLRIHWDGDPISLRIQLAEARQ